MSEKLCLEEPQLLQIIPRNMRDAIPCGIEFFIGVAGSLHMRMIRRIGAAGVLDTVAPVLILVTRTQTFSPPPLVAVLSLRCVALCHFTPLPASLLHQVATPLSHVCS